MRFGSEHEDWIQAMIAAGLGCACLPQFSVIRSELLARPLIEPALFRTISLATVRGRPHRPILSLFSRLCGAMRWDEADF